MAKRVSAGHDDDTPKQSSRIRSFMDATEASLFDAIISSNIINPSKQICELHFACAQVAPRAALHLIHALNDWRSSF